MPEELHAESYKLKVEKLIALTLGVVSLWFCFGDVARGYGPFGDYFGALKLGVCILSFFLCCRVFPKGVIGPAVLCALIALIYNPFFKLDLSYDSWRAVNFVTAIAYAWIIWRFAKVTKLMTPELIEKTRKEEARARLAQARADVMGEAVARGEFDTGQINEFMRKLMEGGGRQNTQPPSSAPLQGSKPNATNEGEVIYFVIKGPPPGVPQTDKNTIVTATVRKIVEPDGTHKSKKTFYSGSDPLTVIEASSVIYWRNQIESGLFTDRQAIDGLHAIQQRTSQNYIILERIDVHPGEIAITSGLAQLSLHYAIAYLSQLNVLHSTVKWMAEQQAKGAGCERVIDYKKAESLKNALAHADVTTEFLTHLRASVAGRNKEDEQ